MSQSFILSIFSSGIFKTTDFHLTKGAKYTIGFWRTVFDSCKIIIASQQKCYLLTKNVVNCNLQVTVPATCSQENVPFTQGTQNRYICHQFHNFIVLYMNAKELTMRLNSFQHFAIVIYFF